MGWVFLAILALVLIGIYVTKQVRASRQIKPPRHYEFCTPSKEIFIHDPVAAKQVAENWMKQIFIAPTRKQVLAAGPPPWELLVLTSTQDRNRKEEARRLYYGEPPIIVV